MAERRGKMIVAVPTNASCRVCGDEGIKYNSDAAGRTSNHFPGELLNGWGHKDGMRRDHQAEPHDGRSGEDEHTRWMAGFDQAKMDMKKNLQAKFDELHARNVINEIFNDRRPRGE